MLWLGVLGRRKIAALEARIEGFESALQKLHEDFRALDLEMTNQVDRLAGIAKRFTGRKGGRPPNPPEAPAEADADAESHPLATPNGFNRHVL